MRFAREQRVPYFGICFGMQMACIEFARNVCGLDKANSTEVDPQTPHPVVDLMPDQRGVTDKGAGVDPASILVKVDGTVRSSAFAHGVVTVRNVTAGRHAVTVTAADYQEAKNMENVGPILPNTRTFSKNVIVR